MAREVISSAARAAEIAARRLRKTGVFDDLRAAIEAAAMTYQALELLDGAAVRTLIGAKAAGLSGTFVRNMQQKVVAEMKRRELQSVADWIVSRVASQFPNVGVVPKRGRVIEVHLDGVPSEEID